MERSSSFNQLGQSKSVFKFYFSVQNFFFSHIEYFDLGIQPEISPIKQLLGAVHGFAINQLEGVKPGLMLQAAAYSITAGLSMTKKFPSLLILLTEILFILYLITSFNNSL